VNSGGGRARGNATITNHDSDTGAYHLRWAVDVSACGAMVTLATPTALLLGVLLAPALLALMMDRQTGRPRARSIALCGMAASVNPLRALWASDHSISHATTLLGNSHVLGAAWSAAAAGWLLAEIARSE